MMKINYFACLLLFAVAFNANATCSVIAADGKIYYVNDKNTKTLGTVAKIKPCKNPPLLIPHGSGFKAVPIDTEVVQAGLVQVTPDKVVPDACDQKFMCSNEHGYYFNMAHQTALACPKGRLSKAKIDFWEGKKPNGTCPP